MANPLHSLLVLLVSTVAALDLTPIDMVTQPYVPMRSELNDRSSFTRATFKEHSWTAYKAKWLFENELGVIGAFNDILSQPSGHGVECVVVDVGVNAGFYTMMSASYGCNVYGFELQHDCIDVASKAASFDDAISHIHLFQNPVSDTSSEMTIKYRDNMQCDGNFGFTREDCPWCDFNKIATEKTFNSTTLDTAFLLGRGKERAIVGTVTSENAPIIKLLKIDIEGHDVHAS